MIGNVNVRLKIVALNGTTYPFFVGSMVGSATYDSNSKG